MNSKKVNKALPVYCLKCGTARISFKESCKCGSTELTNIKPGQKAINSSSIAKDENPLIGCVSLIFMIIIISSFFDTDSTTPIQDNIKDEEYAGVYTVCNEVIKNNLKSPSTAKFPWNYDDKITDLGNKKYMLNGYVDSENSFGAVLRSYYKCTATVKNKNVYIDSVNFED